MKYVVSVSKTYKHRGLHRHRKSTKKYWHIYYYDEEFKFHSEQVSYLKAMYYKCNKYKKFHLVCPNCRKTYMFLVKKEKHLEKQECPDCLESFKDMYEEYAESLNLRL